MRAVRRGWLVLALGVAPGSLAQQPPQSPASLRPYRHLGKPLRARRQFLRRAGSGLGWPFLLSNLLWRRLSLRERCRRHERLQDCFPHHPAGLGDHTQLVSMQHRNRYRSEWRLTDRGADPGDGSGAAWPLSGCDE